MAFTGTPRPRHRWHHASTELRDFAIISYRVDPVLLERLLPAGFEAERIRCDDGRDHGLISAVPFLDRRFHFRWMPLVKIDCGQVNYRAYVRYRGERGVWFFGTSLDTWLVAWPRWRWRMPWFRDRVRIDSTWDGATPATWSLTARGAWGGARCALVGSSARDRVDGFANRDHLLEVLCHPLIGWYRRRDGGVGRYEVWHEVLDPKPCDATEARFDVFERLELIAPGTPPHSAFVQRDVHFDVLTPPVRVALELPPGS